LVYIISNNSDYFTSTSNPNFLLQIFQNIQKHFVLHFFCEMARTKTTSKFADDENSQVECSPSPLQNAAADQNSDQQPLNENPVHTILPDVIYPAFDTPKSSKSKSSKKTHHQT
jgi:hypothetical protein